MDLGELEWEDRERVLRLLFAKMNAGVPPPLWRDNLPAIESKIQSSEQPIKDDSLHQEPLENELHPALPAIKPYVSLSPFFVLFKYK